MKQFRIQPNDAGQRLDRFLEKSAPLLPSSLVQKYIRLKRCKVNGKAIARDYRLQIGDELQLYINDEFFDRPNEDNAYLAINSPKIDVLYEDENILLALKPPGLLSHSAEGEYVNTLLTHIQAYLFQKGEWEPKDSATFRPALCNRIDRNTGGIVIAAKNADTLRTITEKIRLREVDKIYLAAVHGKVEPAKGRLSGFIFKDAKLNKVYVKESAEIGSKSAITEYEVLKYDGKFSIVQCKLLTGRTHQIRAQFAAFGHPLLGDGKYGKPDGEKFQALYSYKVKFNFADCPENLAYLNGMEFTAPIDRVWFNFT